MIFINFITLVHDLLSLLFLFEFIVAQKDLSDPMKGLIFNFELIYFLEYLQICDEEYR